MHLYFIARGNIHSMNSFERFMSTQMFDWRRTRLVPYNRCKSCNHEYPFVAKYEPQKCTNCQSTDWEPAKSHQHTELGRVQGALRPVQLYEYVFPKEALSEVLTMLNMTQGDDIHTDQISCLKKAALRKSLGNGVKELPKIEPLPTSRFIDTRGVDLYPIGIKDDAEGEQKDWQYIQEFL